MSNLDAARDNPFPPKDPEVWGYCPACGAPLFADDDVFVVDGEVVGCTECCWKTQAHMVLP